MRFRRATRVVMVVAGLGALVACGLDVLATGDRPDPTGRPDAAAGDADAPIGDGAPPADAPFGDGSQIHLPPVPDPFLDAGLDANQDNCLAGCPGGACDAGWCVLDCNALGNCTGSTVTCPPGIPCDVLCKGQGSCAQGVDCTQASACRIDCSGLGACTNQPVACTGVACKIDCAGNGSCTKGVTCDAGACTIACTGDGTCTNETTRCNADTCTVRCGVGGDIGRDSCSKGVTCEATQLCDIGCVARDTCRNETIMAASAGTAIIQCTGQATCNKGSSVTGGEAGVLCSGNNACDTQTFCDAGKCTGSCVDEDFTFCCSGGAGVCTRTTKSCQINASNCP